MRSTLTKTALVMEKGQLRSLRDASWNVISSRPEFPPELEILLCLLDGAERRAQIAKEISGGAKVTLSKRR